MLRRPHEKIMFPSFMFLAEAVIKRSRFNNISKWIILLLRCLALTCLALAFAWPFLPKFKEKPESATVLLWDNSFSMNADNYAGELRKKAKDIINETSSLRTVIIGSVGGKDIQWSGSFDSNKEKLVEWFNSCSKGEGSSYFGKIFDIAMSKLSEIPAKKKRIVLLTDRQKYPWWRCPSTIKLEKGIELEIIMPEKKKPTNVAITSAKILNPFSKPDQQLALELELANYTREKIAGQIKVYWMDKAKQDYTITIPPLQSVRKIIKINAGALKPSKGKVVLNIKDNIKIDNIRYFSANPAKLPKIAMKKERTPGSVDFVRIAMAPSSDMKYAKFADLNEKNLNSDIAFAIVKEGMDPQSAVGKKFFAWLNEGGKAVVIWNDDKKMKDMLLSIGIVETLSYDKENKVRRFYDIDFNHPFFKAFSVVRSGGLYEIMFLNPPNLKLPKNASIVAYFDSDFDKKISTPAPAIAEIPVGKGKIILLASGIDRKNSDWPAHPSFLPFWREILDYLNPLQKDDSNITVDSHPIPYDGLKTVTNMNTGEKTLSNGNLFQPAKTGNFLAESASEKRILSVNVPSEESDTTMLPEEFSSDSFVSRERIEKKDTKKVQAFKDYQDLENRQKFSLWWPFMLAGIIFALLELLLANRTAL